MILALADGVPQAISASAPSGSASTKRSGSARASAPWSVTGSSASGVAAHPERAADVLRVLPAVLQRARGAGAGDFEAVGAFDHVVGFEVKAEAAADARRVVHAHAGLGVQKDRDHAAALVAAHLHVHDKGVELLFLERGLGVGPDGVGQRVGGIGRDEHGGADSGGAEEGEAENAKRPLAHRRQGRLRGRACKQRAGRPFCWWGVVVAAASYARGASGG